MREDFMSYLGIRVTPKIIYFAVAELNEDEVEVNVSDKIIIPISLDNPDKLSYARIALFTIINEYKVDNAILRRMEDNSQNINIFRANLEGVIQELISNCRVEKYYAYKLSQLASKLEVTATDLKEGCKSKAKGKNLFDIPDWDNYDEYQKESILCALAATQI